MRRHLAVFALIVCALTGCGSGPPNRAGGAPVQGAGGVSLALSFSPEPLRAGQPVTWSLEVHNGTQDPVTLTFPSGQRGDVVLLRNGTEVYRWSSSKFFAQAVVREPLAAGEDKAFPLEEKALSVEPGDYDLVATLAAEPGPGPARRRVSVEP
jgi:hypothetical protein